MTHVSDEYHVFVILLFLLILHLLFVPVLAIVTLCILFQIILRLLIKMGKYFETISNYFCSGIFLLFQIFHLVSYTKLVKIYNSQSRIMAPLSVSSLFVGNLEFQSNKGVSKHQILLRSNHFVRHFRQNLLGAIGARMKHQV